MLLAERFAHANVVCDKKEERGSWAKATCQAEADFLAAMRNIVDEPAAAQP